MTFTLQMIRFFSKEQQCSLNMIIRNARSFTCTSLTLKYANSLPYTADVNALDVLPLYNKGIFNDKYLLAEKLSVNICFLW